MAFLTSPDSSITYFTQIVPSRAQLLISPGAASLYLSKLDFMPKLAGIKVKQLEADWEKYLTDNKIKKIGVSSDKISYSFYRKLKKIYPKAKFVDVSSKLKELRRQKTKAEIEKIAKACKIAARAFNEFINNYSPKTFKTESDVAFFLEKQIKEQGAELAFPPIVASAEHSAIPHYLTSAAKLRRGFLQLDFGAKYQNYCSDLSRVVCLGPATREQQELYHTLLQAQEETIKQINSGGRCSDLDAFARKKLGKYSSYFIHSLGHGLGIDVHEAPALSSESKEMVEERQVFTIEPGIYFPKRYGMRIEDTVLFDKKVKVLTSAAKDLIVLK